MTGRLIYLLFLYGGLTAIGQTNKSIDYLVSFEDPVSGAKGYKDPEGKIVIQAGVYAMCFTDTFRTYAIVALPEGGFIAINRQGRDKTAI